MSLQESIKDYEICAANASNLYIDKAWQALRYEYLKGLFAYGQLAEDEWEWRAAKGITCEDGQDFEGSLDDLLEARFNLKRPGK